MSVERSEVQHIARLARLRLDDVELDRFTEQLNSILGHMDRLSELDAEPLENEAEGEQAPGQGGAPLRDEDARPDTLERPPSELAPDWRGGFFVVPRLAAQDRLAEGGDAAALEDGDDGS